MLNENTLSVIATFAKSKKINKLELQKLVEDVLGAAAPKVGRKASEATLVLRKELANTPSIVEEYKVKQYTANNCAFIDNIVRQGWISYKQYLVIREIILRSNANASWENDEDNELSKDYYGLQGA